jgi:Phage-related protein
MSSVGPGVIEIRVRAGGAFRLMYVAKFTETIYVLHVFQKKSRSGVATPKVDKRRIGLRLALALQHYSSNHLRSR